MKSVVKNYSLLVLAIALGWIQLSPVQRWNPRRVPADVVFTGDQACAECHKKFAGSFGPTGMAMAMEPIGESKVQRVGKDATIVTYCKGLELSMKAADELSKDGIEVEIDRKSVV